jgi:DNA-binding transcriptional LysR family regulator
MTQRVGKLERTLSVGFVASTLYGLLPDIIRRYRENHPEVDADLADQAHDGAPQQHGRQPGQGRLVPVFHKVSLTCGMLRSS